MKKINSNSGVTLVALIMLIVVMLILLSVVINFSTKSIQDSTDMNYKSELLIIQHAMYQKLIENNEQKNENKDFPGEQISAIELSTQFIEAYKKVLKTDEEPNGQYYKLQEEHLKELSLDGERVVNSEFIVNYETGEVYNSTKGFYSDKVSPVYLPGYATSEEDGTLMSNMIDY